VDKISLNYNKNLKILNKYLARGFLAFCDILKDKDLKNKNQWPNEKEPTLFLVLQKIRQPSLRNLHNWDPALSSHSVKKKENKRKFIA
jgi:hypothetical protein